MTYARTVHEDQEFSFTADHGDNSYLEEYTTEVGGHPASVVVTVSRKAFGKAQHFWSAAWSRRSASSQLGSAGPSGSSKAEEPSLGEIDERGGDLAENDPADQYDP